jgi:hypothetical protein
MAVASRGDALSAFRELINNDPIKAEKVLLLPSYLPPGPTFLPAWSRWRIRSQ